MSIETRITRCEQAVGAGVCPACQGRYVEIRGTDGSLTGPCCGTCQAAPVLVRHYGLTVADLEAV
jgi:hypothetical protein